MLFFCLPAMWQMQCVWGLTVPCPLVLLLTKWILVQKYDRYSKEYKRLSWQNLNISPPPCLPFCFWVKQKRKTGSWGLTQYEHFWQFGAHSSPPYGWCGMWMDLIVLLVTLCQRLVAQHVTNGSRVKSTWPSSYLTLFYFLFFIYILQLFIFNFHWPFSFFSVSLTPVLMPEVIKQRLK